MENNFHVWLKHFTFDQQYCNMCLKNYQRGKVKPRFDIP